MTYYDHETNMTLKLGIWSEKPLAQHSERRSWVIEKELAELRSKKPSVFKGVISTHVNRFRAHWWPTQHT